MKKRKQFFLTIVIVSVMIGFLAGVVGELWVNSFLLPDPYLNFKNYHDLTRKIDDLIAGEKQDKDLTEQDAFYREVIGKAQPAIVSIYADKEFKQSGFDTFEKSDFLGQGIIITNDGWILTHSTVANNLAADYWVRLNDKKLYQTEKVINEQRTGIVFLKIQAQNLPVAEFALKNDLTAGQNVFVFSNSKIKSNNLSQLNYAPKSSIKDYIHSSQEFYKFVLLEQEVDSEFIGSPVINLEGKTIGFLAQENGLIIPVDHVLPLLRSLGGDEYVWPYLGINFYDLSEVLNPNFENKKGAQILSTAGIEKTSPAFGILQAGDIIKKVEQEEINENKNLPELISQYQVGDKVRFTIMRDSEQKEVEITLVGLE